MERQNNDFSSLKIDIQDQINRSFHELLVILYPIIFILLILSCLICGLTFHLYKEKEKEKNYLKYYKKSYVDKSTCIEEKITQQLL